MCVHILLLKYIPGKEFSLVIKNLALHYISFVRRKEMAHEGVFTEKVNTNNTKAKYHW